MVTLYYTNGHWKNCINHCEKVKMEYWECDHIFDREMMPLNMYIDTPEGGAPIQSVQFALEMKM